MNWKRFLSTWAAIAAFFIASTSFGATVFNVDGAGNLTAVNSIGAALAPGESSNCGITYASSTLTLTDESGAALSATNPCCFGVPSTAGQNKTICFTAAQSSTFGATSDTDGNTFGTTASVAWGSVMPKIIYACDGNSADYIAFSRDPRKSVTGAAAGDMCQEGDEDCDAQGDLFIMTSGLTLADEVDRPCVPVGAFRDTKDASDQWTVATLGNTDGIGQDRLTKTFATTWTFPTGQNGNESGKLFTSTDGATALAFTTYNGTYQQREDGSVRYTFACDNQTAAGADGTPVRFYLPLSAIAGVNNYGAYGIAYAIIAGSRDVAHLRPANWSAASTYMLYYSAAYGGINDNQFSGGTDQVWGQIIYSAF